MVTARFNTQILSQNSDNPKDINEYKLDDVISKDFGDVLFGYVYTFDSEVPDTVQILRSFDGFDYLIIPPKLQLKTLSILVTENIQFEPKSAVATTSVIIDPKPNFNSLKNSLLENDNFVNGVSNAKLSWSAATSSGVSPITDDPVKPI